MAVLDDLARLDSAWHRIHPAAHLTLTLVLIALVSSVGRYDGIRLVPFLLYPVIIFAASPLPVRPVLARASLALPFVLGFGLAGLLTDRAPVLAYGIILPGGWISLATLILKTGLTVLAALLLVALTGIVKLSYALRLLRVPRLLVLQILLTYRYIAVLLEETMWTTQAYKLRAGGRPGIRLKDWGNVGGSLLLGTYDRARHVYWAMTLAGFNGDIHPGQTRRLAGRDYFYLAIWSLYFVLCRIGDIPGWLGRIGGSL
jgi:cobalt/nickel transport system permease protein